MTTILPMAADIASFEQLHRLTHLNGVPIGVIEDRARPRTGWSYGGFLGPQDRFLEVLNNDWETVSSLGLTHTEIAAHLNQIIRNACSGCGGIGSGGEQKEISYDFSQVQNAKLPKLIEELNRKTQKTVWERFFEIVALRIETVMKVTGIYNKISALIESFALIYQHTLNSSNVVSQFNIHLLCNACSGCQEDIFKQGDRLSRGGSIVTEWSRDYVFTNRETGESIKVAHGVIEYIRRYGFYEGNVPYRVDPLKLLSVLTGVKVQDLQTYTQTT